ncbi:hypothetical protein GCM10029976_026680 [Kribbella albertanoniae]|uniref:Uncharacterized protein n=1 Tax=Kribbella albertanoniae TaxID=1266829 RepID=A0A4R4PXW1_9ACTN|nr:hypothetical protein [Kribbella albertanoniae]TDC27406.1 hypothetical protein E1261_20760 [Kribbella albertanoniae]
MDLTLRVGEKLFIKEGRVSVTTLDAHWLPRIRGRLIEVAANGETITYGTLKQQLGLPHPPNGLGRLLDLLSVDCERRGEPSLASLVVNSGTGEVGHDFDGEPMSERGDVYRQWRADGG